LVARSAAKTRSGIKNVRLKRRRLNEVFVFLPFSMPRNSVQPSRAEYAMGLSSIVCTISLAIGAPRSGQTESLSRGEGASHLLLLFAEMNAFFYVIYVKGVPLKIEAG
jgi:hypothetical protein